MQEIFQEVGRDLYKEVPMTKLDPQYRITFGAGGELNATPDLERMVAEISRLSPFQCPSLFSILSFLEYEHGIWHPTGGCNSIPQL